MDKPAKLPYTKPVLIRYGSIVEMTTGVSLGMSEGQIGPMCNTMALDKSPCLP